MSVPITKNGMLPNGDDDFDSQAVGLCECDLQTQNAEFAGTGGISCNNRDAGFVPAYQNTATGEAVVSCYADGRRAPVHVLDGLPENWIEGRNEQGCVTHTITEVVVGFLRGDVFFTREAAAAALRGESNPDRS